MYGVPVYGSIEFTITAQKNIIRLLKSEEVLIPEQTAKSDTRQNSQKFSYAKQDTFEFLCSAKDIDINITINFKVPKVGLAPSETFSMSEWSRFEFLQIAKCKPQPRPKFLVRVCS